MPIIIADENGTREVSDKGNIICPECYASNDYLEIRCRNCGTKLRQTELTYEQEDYIIESGMERERERKKR